MGSEAGATIFGDYTPDWEGFTAWCAESFDLEEGPSPPSGLVYDEKAFAAAGNIVVRGEVCLHYSCWEALLWVGGPTLLLLWLSPAQASLRPAQKWRASGVPVPALRLRPPPPSLCA